MGEPQKPTPPTFGDLVQRFGISAALDLLPVFDPNAGTGTKVLGGSRAINQFLQAYLKQGGSLPGWLQPYAQQFGPALGLAGGAYAAFDPNAPTGSRVLGGLNAANSAANLAGYNVPYAGPALSAAALGYNLSNIAGDSNLSQNQKVGHSVDTTVAAAVPMYGLSRLANSVFGENGLMQRSGSPTVRDTGRAIAAPALPIERLLDVLRGDRSPSAAFNAGVNQMKELPGIGHAMGSVLGAFGLGTPPTTGTTFRKDFANILGQLGEPGMATDKGYNVDLSKFSQDQIDVANKLAQTLAQYSPTAKGNAGKNYWTQGAALLLNKYGADLPNAAARIGGRLTQPSAKR